ncbi:MAG: tetratricopeptide repeat protein [Candidatus Solibacter sp.]|nr:tetratricopeptide repeat protein [Candidatus Solibacter sp.]
MAVIRDGRRTGLGQREKVPPQRVDSTTIGLRDAATWALILCATLVAYLPALRGAVLWDDNMHVTRADLRSLHGLWRIWFDLGATQQYYPLLHSAFWLEHRIWGDAVLGYHLTNVALHAASACLVVIIVRRLSLPGASLAGFVFALHPVCVEAVAWISEQKSTLSGVFYLAAALTYLHFDRTRRKSQYFMALGLFVLALMTKTVTATLPAAMLVIFWWQRGRLGWRRDLLPLVPWFAVGASAGLFTAWVESSPQLIGAQGPQYALTLAQRLLLAGRVPWFYAWKVLWPANLMFIYPRWKIDSGELSQYLFPLGMAALAVALGLLARKNRGPLAGFLFFAGTLFPALGFLNVYPFRYSYVADHFQYLAILGIIVPAASGLTALAGRISPDRISQGTLAIALPALLLTTLGAATRQQSAIYRDYETLFRETLAHNPGSSFLHSNLGVILMSTRRETEAAAEFEAAVRLSPHDPDYRVNLGLALAQMPGRLPDAIAEYQTALRTAPNLYAAHLNLGLALMSIPGRSQDAIAEYRKAIAATQATLRSDPGFWQAHLNLGIAYSQMPGRQADAITEYRTALRMKPDSALAHFHLGNTLHKMGRLPDAIAEYQESLSIDPGVPEVHYELAYALAQTPGRVQEAIAECQKMLLLKPGDEPGRQLVASLLAFRDGRGR